MKKATIKTPQALDMSPMEAIVNWNLLKYSAGRAIFCPACETIMDCRRTVLVSLYATHPGQEEKLYKTYTQCDRCYDKRKEAFNKAIADVQAKEPGRVIRIEILDGRDPIFRGKR